MPCIVLVENMKQNHIPWAILSISAIQVSIDSDSPQKSTLQNNPSSATAPKIITTSRQRNTTLQPLTGKPFLPIIAHSSCWRVKTQRRMRNRAMMGLAIVNENYKL